MGFKTSEPLTAMVAALLQKYGLKYETEWSHGELGMDGERIRVDFWVCRTRDYVGGMNIECRWQSTSGSVSKKLWSLAENIVRCYSLPTVIVIDGTAQEIAGIRERLASECRGSLIGVMNLAEFADFTKSLSDGNAKAFIVASFDPDQLKLFASH